MANGHRTSVFGALRRESREKRVERGPYRMGNRTLRAVSKHRAREILFPRRMAKSNYRSSPHGWHHSLCRVAEIDIDNRIPAGHAAFLNSSSYTTIGYGSTGYAPDAEVQMEVVLKVAFHQPARHPSVGRAKEPITRIEQGTEGRVPFSFYPSSTLVPTADMASVVADGTTFATIRHMPCMSKINLLFEIEANPVWSAGTCKSIIDAYDHGPDDAYPEALKRQGPRGFRGRVATDGKPEVGPVRPQEARSRGGD